MPVYTYKCTKCGLEFDKPQKLDEKPLAICPRCLEETDQKIINKVAFHLKGGCWAKDGYTK